MRSWFFGPILLLAINKGVASRVDSSPLISAWGVDALLSCHLPEADLPSYLSLLTSSGVDIVRERDTGYHDLRPESRDYAATFKEATASGLMVVAFAQENRDLGKTRWGPFPADLNAVYAEGFRIGSTFANYVAAWELHNEPELAWWPDMPDRYSAHAKALYLGLMAGADSVGTDTPILLGSLGLPSGPWLERNARNGVLAYADAWNVHYYGDASQFTGFLNGHVKAMEDLLPRNGGGGLKLRLGRRWPAKDSAASGFPSSVPCAVLLPIWATEVGVNTVTSDTWADPVRRKRQADWLLSTAKQALAHPNVAVFMPFVLVHEGDGYALTESAEKIWPAWEEYARFTRKNPFPARPAIRRSSSVNPVVLQWLADAETASGHKLAASYRWHADGKPITGEFRLYNFSSTAVSGSLRQSREAGDGTGVLNGEHKTMGRAVAMDVPAVGSKTARPGPAWLRRTANLLTIPPGGMLSISLSFALEDAPKGGEREWRQFTFEEKSGRCSELGFALERSPNLYPPQTQPLALKEWGAKVADFRFVPHAQHSEPRRWWWTINGVKVRYAEGALARFELGERPFDQEYPPMAAAYLPEGLPKKGWLRVAARELGPAGVRIRVDLVDRDGRRFTQWENLGQVRGLSASTERWLNLLDFHPYAWGKLDKQRRLKPEEVCEVQLRFYAAKGPTMVDVELGFAREYGRQLDLGGELPIQTKQEKIAAPVE